MPAAVRGGADADERRRLADSQPQPQQQQQRIPCVPSKPGDFRYRSCATFCKVASARSHCAFCKCMDCKFCINPAAVSGTSSGLVNAPAVRKQPKGGAAAAAAAAAARERIAATMSSTGGGGGSGSSGGGGSSSGSSGSGGGAGVGIGGPATTADFVVALRDAEARARRAEDRVASLEKQLSLCRHSAEKLRSSGGGSGGSGGDGSSAYPASSSRGGSLVSSLLLRRGGRGNATELQLCAQSIARAIERQRLGSSAALGGALASLNLSSGGGSARGAVQLHLHQHDFEASRCPHPNQFLLAAGRLPYGSGGGGGGGGSGGGGGAGAALLEDDTAVGGDETVASLLLFVGLVLCALCNAWSLGYLQPSRGVRRALRMVGCELELVR